jgi:flagellar protein FlgJ
MKQIDFVKKYIPFAKQAEEKKGISAVFTLAQAALESGWGESAPGNMFFGVKASKDTPENKRQLLTTTEVLSDDKQGYRFPLVLSITRRADGKYTYRIKDWFRKYDTPEECFSDHADFFYRNKRYSEALKVKHDPYLFAEAIAQAGYATDPNYSNTLKSIIRTIETNL